MVFGIVLIIIIIHSILIAITDTLENKSVSQIAYFVEFIMISVVILASFSNCLTIVKDTIQDLVGFTNSILPILITLMLTTGAITSASVVQPILLLLISFIGNIIINFILPIILISTSLNIISQMILWLVIWWCVPWIS